jgi:hypothetical protein
LLNLKAFAGNSRQSGAPRAEKVPSPDINKSFEQRASSGLDFHSREGLD